MSPHDVGGPDLAATRRVAGWEETNSTLHEARIDAVMERLLSSGAETVVDLGCGAGAILLRLVAEPSIRRIVGIDSSPRALLLAEQVLTSDDGTLDPRLSLRQASVTDVQEDLDSFDAAVMVETIEHLDPALLGRLERSVFVRLRPRLVVLTTPNSEYNTLFGLEPDEYRHPDHRFEWDRRKFERWGNGVANRTGYSVEFEGVGPANAWFGSATQLAAFHRIDHRTRIQGSDQAGPAMSAPRSIAYPGAAAARTTPPGNSPTSTIATGRECGKRSSGSARSEP